MLIKHFIKHSIKQATMRERSRGLFIQNSSRFIRIRGQFIQIHDVSAVSPSWTGLCYSWWSSRDGRIVRFSVQKEMNHCPTDRRHRHSFTLATCECCTVTKHVFANPNAAICRRVINLRCLGHVNWYVIECHAVAVIGIWTSTMPFIGRSLCQGGPRCNELLATAIAPRVRPVVNFIDYQSQTKIFRPKCPIPEWVKMSHN